MRMAIRRTDDDDDGNDVHEDCEDGNGDLIAAAGATSSRPLKVLPRPRKGSSQLHDLSHLLIIILKPMVTKIMIFCT